MNPFSFKRAALHAGVIGLAFAIVQVATLALLPSHTEFEKLGYRIGLGAPVLLLVFGIACMGISALWQKGRRMPALGILVPLLLGSGFGVHLLGKASSGSALDPGDRQPLVRVDQNGEHRIRHAGLGFSLLDPSPDLEPSPAIEAQLQAQISDPTTHTFVYAGDDTGTTLLITLFGGVGSTQASLRQVVADVERGLRKSVLPKLPEGSTQRRIHDDLDWTDQRKRFRTHQAFGDHLHLRIAAHAATSRRGQPYVVMLILWAMGPDDYVDLMDSLRVE